MSTLTNYEGLLALSTSPHLSQAMRGYLVGVLAEHREMRVALETITQHFADVMGGPIMGAHVKFAGGVEGIPTIAKARAVLAKVNT